MNSFKETRLDSGEPFPALALRTTAGSELNIPGDFSGSWSVLLSYRGDW